MAEDRLNLVLLERDEVGATRAGAAPGAVVLTGVRADHLLRVLGVERGRQVRVGVVDGPMGIGTVESMTGGAVHLTCAFDTDVPPRPAVDLLLALPRPKVLRRLWAQIAALGAGRILLTNAERVARDYFDAHVVAPASYRPLLLEGLQQARDTRLPVVTIHRQLKVLIEDGLDTLCPDSLRLVADPSATTSAGDALRAQPPGRVLLAVGPEGGWNAYERDLLRAHGFETIGMGPRTLRSDTATIALLALVHDAVGRRKA